MSSDIHVAWHVWHSLRRINESYSGFLRPSTLRGEKPAIARRTKRIGSSILSQYVPESQVSKCFFKYHLYIYIYVWWNSHVLGTIGGWKWWNPNEIFHSRSFFFGLDNHKAVSVFVVFLLRTRFLDDQLVLLKGQFGQSTNVVVVVWKWGTPKNDKKCLPSGYD